MEKTSEAPQTLQDVKDGVKTLTLYLLCSLIPFLGVIAIIIVEIIWGPTYYYD